LSCEIFFYLIFPLLILSMRSWGWRRTIGAASLACVLTLLMLAVGISDQLKPITHLSDFLMGIATYRAFDLLIGRGATPSGKWFYSIGFAGSAAIIAYARFLPKTISMNTLLRPMNALLLLGLGLGGGWIARALSKRPIVFLGKASYGMYILHVPILWWWPRSAVRHLYVAFVVAVSCLVYTVLEEPANRWIRSLVKKAKDVGPVRQDEFIELETVAQQ
jgi:peptidoglycan/LPS O-acetylase OafA/YrhL